MSIREALDQCCPPDQDAGFCESWGCRTVRQILDRAESAEARVARLEKRLVDVKSAADDVLAAVDPCRTYEEAMATASILCGTLQFISGHAAPTEAAPC